MHGDIEMINCVGCRINGVKSPFCDSICPIRKCASERKYETCADCAELEECEKTFSNLRIGCTNVIEYPSAEKIREAIHSIRTTKILTETDAPFLPPQTMRGQQNEPAYVTYVYEKLCEILNISQNELEKIVEENTRLLYDL